MFLFVCFVSIINLKVENLMHMLSVRMELAHYTLDTSGSLKKSYSAKYKIEFLMSWILVGVKGIKLNTCFLVNILRCNKHIGY